MFGFQSRQTRETSATSRGNGTSRVRPAVSREPAQRQAFTRRGNYLLQLDSFQHSQMHRMSSRDLSCNRSHKMTSCSVPETEPYYTSTVLSNVTKLVIVLCLLIVLVAAVLIIVRIRNPAYFRSKILHKSDNPENVSDQDA